MKPSKLFITSLLAAAAMSAVPAYAASLTDATLSIESFTTENITALGTAGWTVSGITISGTDGTFTTGTEGTPLPSITATDRSSNTLSTAVSGRYTFSTIVTVDASLFSGTSSGNIIAGSTISNGSVSTSNAIGVGFSSGNIIGTWECNGYNTQTSLDVSNSIVNGKVTIGLVFAGGTGANLYLADGSTINLNGLRSNSNYKAIILSNRAVTYSNLYWFNTALSGADMQAAVVSATSTGTRQASLTWAGGTSGTWDYESDTNWTMPGESGTVSTAFQDWDGVTFATDGAQVELTQSSGSYWLKNLTVSAATSLTGTGTVRVDAANLTTSAAMTLGENVVLDLGNISAATTVNNVVGPGTVKVVSTSPNGHDAILTLESDFSGTIEYSGKFNTGNGTVNLGAKFALSNGSMWGSNTLENDIHFLTDYQIGDSRGTTITLNGNLTQADGTTLTIGTSVETNITFGGRANLYHLKQSTGTLTIGGATTVTGNYTGSSGTDKYSVLTVNAGASLSVGGDLTLRQLNNNTDNIGATMDVSGEVSVDGNFWIARDGKGIVNIYDGGTVVANTLTFGQAWDGASEKGSTVNLEEGGTLVVGTVVANTTAVNNSTPALNASELNLNGGTLGTSAESLTIDVTKGSKTLSVVLGTGTTSTINTGKYDTATKTFMNTEAAISIANVISGDGALKKAGAGMLTLSNANTYKGGTVIEAGTVVAAHANALGTTKGVEVQSGATLNLGASTVTVAGLSGAGSVGLANGRDSATLTVNGGGVFTGTLTNVSLVKQGADSTLELRNAGNWNSSATVEAGTLRIAPDTIDDYSYVSITSVSVSDGAKLEIAPNSSAAVSFGLNATSGVTFAAGSKLVVDLTGAATDVALSIITSSAIKYNNGTEDVSLTSDDLNLFVNNFVTLNGWDGLAGWAYTDNVLSVTLTIPEPSTFGLLAGLGALALAGTRRRRKKA